MKNTFAFLFLTAAVVLPSIHALAAHEAGHASGVTMAQPVTERSAGDITQAPHVAPAEISRGFTLRDREAVYNYLKLPADQRSIREDIRSKEHGAPGALIGSRLSPEIAVMDLGVKMQRKLTPPKPGVKFGAVGVDMVAIDLNSRQIIDYVPNVIPEYIK